ncbi:unnamed protein product [Phytophthora lilii]|uniref:Unnamed protein product n=1 Tax=Phytophthora lilii TaxID=2077276 RepID=A0A9W6XL13_9STRA|nr:unnamed protein product [Phytophthora lilii]
MKVFVVVTIALAAFCASEAEASKKYVKMLPNGGNVPNTPAIGHADGTGDEDATNAFGDAFAAADYAWTKELCEADTDGDGQTNGQELGDPCCEWTMGGTPLWTTGVSNPGDASSTSDPSLWANACGASTSETTSETSDSTTSAPATESESESTTESESEPADESDETNASSITDEYGSTNTTSSASASSTPAAEKCVSDLASTRALRTGNKANN